VFWLKLILSCISLVALRTLVFKSLIKDGKWKDKLEKRLQTDERVTLTALGDVRYDLMRYVKRRKDVKIVKLETRYMKTREKGSRIESHCPGA
jgi:hypothetical protein